MGTNLLPIPALQRTYARLNFSCIYRIFSISNGKEYIGSAKHFGIRMRNHVHQLQVKKHHSTILQNHCNKYGVDDLVFQVLEVIPWDKNYVSKEQHYIDLHNPYFNVLRDARGAFGKKSSPETIEKLRVSHLGQKPSADSRKKRSISMKIAYQFMTDESKKNRKKGGLSKGKRIICNETGIDYPSIAEAERVTGCDNISSILSGTRKHSKNLTFKYYEL